jgi:hypothetical protein
LSLYTIDPEVCIDSPSTMILISFIVDGNFFLVSAALYCHRFGTNMVDSRPCVVDIIFATSNFWLSLTDFFFPSHDLAIIKKKDAKIPQGICKTKL